MLKNYIITAFRNLWKKKLFSTINIIGLSVGIACFYLMMINVRDELAFDRFHEKGDHTYRIALERIYPDNVVNYAIIPYSIGEAMQTDFPEIKEMTRIFKFRTSVIIRYEDKIFEEDKFLMVEPNFFSIFSIPVLRGDPETMLEQNNTLVVTRETAVKYFGDENPVGKQLITPNGPFMVSGVCENISERSHLEYDFIGNIRMMGFQNRPNYVSFSVNTYVVLEEGASPADLEAKMPDMVARYAAGQIKAQTGISYEDYVAAGNGYNYTLQPLRNIHLYSRLEGEIKPNGNIVYVYILIAIALFLIIIACINFMNLATARSASRAREVGIRKVVGAQRRQLIGQFLLESVITGLISVAIAAVLIKSITPLFNNLARKQLTLLFFQQPVHLILLGLIGILVGLLAGIYPSLFLSSHRPATVLKGRFATSRSGVYLRNGLVIFQFVTSIVLIAMTLTVASQMRYMTGKDLGFDEENLILIDRAYTLGQSSAAFKNEIRRLPTVEDAAGSNTPVSGGDYYGVMFRSEGETDVKTTRGMDCDQDFFSTLGLEIVEGRGFSTEFNDTRSMLINQAAIREFGWENPIGRKLKRVGNEDEPTGEYTIIGVVRDFHYNSLHNDIDSFVFFLRPEDQVQPYFNVRIKQEGMESTLMEIQSIWNRFTNNQPFSYVFLDDMLAEIYTNERASGRIFGIFSLLAILIAGIGLFGLSAYMAEQKTKEIGIRKVLGASTAGIIFLLSKDFARLVIFAFLLSLPFSVYLMHSWLQNFAFRTGIHIWVFLAAGGIALLTAQLTVSAHTLNAARKNPADTLRFE
jgi:putative ABC transport system permease protein